MTDFLDQIDIDIATECNDWPDNLAPRMGEAIRHALKSADVIIEGPLEVSILLTDDAAQREINKKWRGKDSATNVLSFPQFEPFSPLFGLLGDISLAYETLVREAKELDKPFEDHFTHLMVHATLHLVGYDHETDDDALVMEGLETKILNDLGVQNPYD